MFFVIKIIALTVRKHWTSPKLVNQNIPRWKERLSQKLVCFSSKNPTALTLLSKVPPCTIILVQDQFFYLTIWKPTAQTFQNTLSLDQYLFNSRSKFHINLVHWNSLHPKKAILLIFFWTNTTFPLWNSQNQKKQPRPSKSWVRCGQFEPKGGGQTYTKSGAIIVTTRWQ